MKWRKRIATSCCIDKRQQCLNNLLVSLITDRKPLNSRVTAPPEDITFLTSEITGMKSCVVTGSPVKRHSSPVYTDTFYQSD